MRVKKKIMLKNHFNRDNDFGSFAGMSTSITAAQKK